MKETRELVKHQIGGCLHVSVQSKPHIPVTLICVDTVKPKLAERVIESCLELATFDDVKLLTNDTSLKHSVKIDTLQGIEGYSNFMIRELGKYVSTSHCLVVQWDGYMLNPAGWRSEFLKYGYLGSPWQNFTMRGGNGGFSLRSKRLLDILATRPFGDAPHPEDNYICYRHADELEALGIKFCSKEFSNWFSYEGRMWTGGDWVSHPQPWQGQFGFHSFLTKLPMEVDRPLIYHHTGDYGDIIYSLPVIKTLGEGVLWLSPDCKYPFPAPPHGKASYEWANNICGLLNLQDYIWKAQFTPSWPHSCDFDLNAFRNSYSKPSPANFRSIFRLHLDEFKTDYPEDQPWLKVDYPVEIPGRPIVVNRTQRYHNDLNSMWPVLKPYEDQCVFIGSYEEYHAFRSYIYPMTNIPHYPTPTLLDAARVIAGCKVFVGNQSCPMAIAIGLGKNIIQESWPSNNNCIFKRPNIRYLRKYAVEMPKEWLK